LRLIPVLDLKAGRAVLAVAGDRDHYRPVRSVLHEGSDPLVLARAYRDWLGLSELYLADLDAIAGLPPDVSLYRELQNLGLSLWVDAGVRGPESLAPLAGTGVATVVVGLETVRGPVALAGLIDALGPAMAFSLDLRDGRPLAVAGRFWPPGAGDPRRYAEDAIRHGCRRLLLLDLARVGTASGTGTTPLLRELRSAHPAVEIAVGGGVAGPADLHALAGAGASAVLVGSALHDGRISRDEVEALAARSGRR
jgi:phosphoribosylformimino-5-aminoimidazole carboxamide ribotide isomerase